MIPDRVEDLNDERVARLMKEVLWKIDDIRDALKITCAYWRVNERLTDEKDSAIQDEARNFEMLLRALHRMAERLWHQPNRAT